MSRLERILVALLLLLNIQPGWGQDAQKLFQKGFEAQKNGAYQKALEYYDRAIEENDSIKEAFYNRASVRIALERYQKAKEDLDRTLELDPEYIPAYFNRANIRIRNGYYEKAEEDLNRVIERDAGHTEALLLRGRIRQQLGKHEKACQDLRKAAAQGSEKAKRRAVKHCEREDPLDLEERWPDPEGWTVGNRKEDRHIKKIELLPKGETREDWKRLASIMALKHVQNIPMDTARFFLVKQAQGKCDGLRTETLKKVEDGNERYIFFTLHCSEHINTQEAETQFWYVEQGEKHLYAHFVAVRKAEMSPAEKERWMGFFRE